jgi:dTDP-4-dehydrorhamnose 3,5-epimerase
MRTIPTEIPEIKLIVPTKLGDERGFFSETYRADRLASAGVNDVFVQDNHSFSPRVGTIRGLHFQAPPYAQAKIVRVTRGAIYDVAVDIRRGSPTFGRHVGVRLSAAEWNQLYVPVGFAHGFCVIEPDTEVLYKASAYYAPESDHGLAWNDADLGIRWPVDEADARVSARDQRHPTLAALAAFFEWSPDVSQRE